MQDLWYKTAVIYCVDVEKYADSDGDGVGDLRGLTEKLDHIAGLGATCLWLLPFFVSPRKDNGYDVVDYYCVDPRLGTLRDFSVLVKEAGERGMRVMIDLVMAHTSDEHPWFLAARRDRRSRYRGYYLWADSPPAVPLGATTAFPGEDDRLWTYDEVAGAYYYHRFYRFQPQLDFRNPEVRREAEAVMDFWLAMGVSGFRLDALPVLVGPDPALPGRRDTHGWLRRIRERVSQQRPDTALLGEVDLDTEQLVEYFGNGDEMNMLFGFFLNGHIWLAVAGEDKEPLLKALGQLPAGPPGCQWVNFLRNLDELNLSWLSPDDRALVYERFAPDEGMRAYGRGIRRRLSPMLGDPRLVELAWALTFSLPGAPLIVYGDEIGLGDDLGADGRAAVRVPMQWSSARNGGFSTARPGHLVRPVVSKGAFSYRRVNVERQSGDPSSRLSFMRRLIAAWRACPEFALGRWHPFDTGAREVMAHHCVWKDGHVVAVHNLSHRPSGIRFDVRDHRSRLLQPVFGEAEEREVSDGVWDVALGPYGYRWYRVTYAATGEVPDPW